jgi:hypothetical protein
MIDKKFEPYYDILLSVFLGVIIIIILHNMYESPRIIVIEDDNKEYFSNIRPQCEDILMRN